MKPTIPLPDKPQHVANLCTTQLLEAQGFEGPDKSIEISVLEYGAAWRTLPDGQLLFIYGIRRHEKGDCDWVRFDRSTLAPDYDVFKEHDWINWDEFFESLGVERAEWVEYPLAQKMNDLLSTYGYEEIFGSSYWEGFRIFEHCELIDCHNDPLMRVKLSVNSNEAREFMLCADHAKQFGC